MAHADSRDPAAALRGDVRRAKGEVPHRHLRRASGGLSRIYLARQQSQGARTEVRAVPQVVAGLMGAQ